MTERVIITNAGRRALTRRQELLAIAAEQFATRGYHNVTVDDIGAAAGVTGPALYHHFTGKEQLLGEMLIAISEHLLHGGRSLAELDTDDLLQDLILFHCRFAVANEALITVHFRDLIYASATDQQRVRQLQARYVALWVGTLIALDPSIDRRTARAKVHATFGLINSTPFSSALPQHAMIELLRTMSINALAEPDAGSVRRTAGLSTQ
jgi:AcrR family transcriptional regulator